MPAYSPQPRVPFDSVRRAAVRQEESACDAKFLAGREYISQGNLESFRTRRTSGNRGSFDSLRSLRMTPSKFMDAAEGQSHPDGAFSAACRTVLQAVHRRRPAGVHPLLQHAQVGTKHDVAAQGRSAPTLRIGVAQVLELRKIAAVLTLKLLYLHKGKYRPIEVHLP